MAAGFCRWLSIEAIRASRSRSFLLAAWALAAGAGLIEGACLEGVGLVFSAGLGAAEVAAGAGGAGLIGAGWGGAVGSG